MFFLTISQVHIFAWSITIHQPIWNHNRPAWGQNDNACWPLPIVTGQNPPQSINVSFYVNVSNSYSYFVNLIVSGNITYTSQTYTHSGSGSVTHQIPFANFCYNYNTQIQVIVTRDNETQTASRYVRVYSEYQSTSCPSGIGAPLGACNIRNITEQTSGQMSIKGLCCSQFGQQGVNGTRYRVTFTVNGNFQNKIVTVNEDLSYGFKVGLPIDGCRWAGIYSSSNSQVVFFTFVYYISLAGGQNYWWPCKPEEAAVAYTVQEVPPQVPPIIQRIRQSPSIININTRGQMITELSQGNAHGIHFQWTSFNRPTFMSDDASTNTSNAVNIYYNYGGSNWSPDAPGYHFRSKAINNYGWDQKLSPAVVYSTNSGGGCPFVYVQNEDSAYKQDNNILHRSEFSDYYSIDITDYYKLNITPGVFDNKINIKIIELNNDYSYLDKIGMLVVDHSSNKKIGVTESGNIVTYDTSQIRSSLNSLLNTDSNITKYIYYGYRNPSDSGVEGSDGDNVSLGSINNVNHNGDSLAFIISVGDNFGDNIIYPNPAKDYAGSISIYINSLQNPINKYSQDVKTRL